MVVQAITKLAGTAKPLLSRVCFQQRVVSAASIVSKSLREPDYKRPAPFPYETKRYTILHWYMLDGTVKRFDENSKLIVVDGNIGAGKTKLAKQLAEEFDMKFIPEPSLDRFYINKYGYDLRQLDPLMPPSFKSCDLKKFYEDPYDRNVTSFQFRMFMLRTLDYIDALAHILNTGQGVVMDRCVYSDRVFIEAMYLNGYIRKEALDVYHEVYESVMQELMKPCLIIYLDITPELAMQRIRERNNPIEVNSKVLNANYLADIENQYKQSYLKELSSSCELLVYDWSHFGDPEVVVEDIEHIDFDNYPKYGKMLKDWRRPDDWDWSWQRYMYTTRQYVILNCARAYRPRVTELVYPHEEILKFLELRKKIPGERFEPGFNSEMGDKGSLFKLGSRKRNDNLELFYPTDQVKVA